MALLVTDEIGASLAAQFILPLTRASPRGHLLIDLRPSSSPRRAVATGPHGPTSADVSRATRDARQWLTHGWKDRAEALLSGAAAVAHLLACPIEQPVTRVLVQLRLREGRLEEAHRAAASLNRRSNTNRPHRSELETTMYLLDAIPDLLVTVAESPDDQSVLAGACRWAARHTGGEVAFIDAPRGLVISAHPQAFPSMSSEERRRLALRDQPSISARPDGIVVSAPMRYAGALIGHVVCVGPAERQRTLAEAASHLAALCGPALRTRLDLVEARELGATRIPEMLGRSPAIAALREAIVRAALSPFAVVIEGESGSGKELVARAIHRLSHRRDRRFAALNCAALTDELAETELFGHTRGAFTGAVGPRLGLFEDAHQGTLFLDEVAELSPRTQAKLLRALQEREVRRLGDNVSRPVDVRIVSATNRPLRRMITDGRFREDLLFRLSVIRIQVPPLRERAEDIPVIAIHVWKQLTREMPTRAWLGPDGLSRLARHSWPGNVRELQNIMAALVVNAPTRGRISERHVVRALEHASGTSGVTPESLVDARHISERRAVVGALTRHGGRRTLAARELGLSRQGLAKAIKRLHIDQSSGVEGVA
jgi:transcriptional regulator with PAS, ATPase and Fis domain